ncbi:MAG: selenide, water dikinase SelD, partial [Bacteroidetes bacterium]|nr:selenide, water dikinase SelD [Bacteroidota bacterium]
GIIMAGQRLGMAIDADIAEAKKLMKLLNKTGADVMKKYNVKGATDVTGFGLAGHALKMAKASKVSLRINMKKVALIGNSYILIDEGCIPGASFRNLEFAENDTLFAPDLDYNLKMIAFDAQTSGGLLFCAPPDKVDKIMADLQDAGLRNAKVIGYVTEPEEKLIYLNN